MYFAAPPNFVRADVARGIVNKVATPIACSSIKVASFWPSGACFALIAAVARKYACIKGAIFPPAKLFVKPS